MEGITNCKYLIISFVSGTGAAANPSLCIIHTIVYSTLPRAILQLLLVTSANAWNKIILNQAEISGSRSGKDRKMDSGFISSYCSLD